ncbi:MAG: ATP-binding cassette domain-containing protein [Planctomycetota bacterium]|jgi:sodium transport system ATP-binding protein|nr:ATP-binding cassette domain-containing protein [Planctomycetota bacterium]
MIRAEGLTKIFQDPRGGGEFRAVNDVSFTCSPGRIFGLLGPNGAGKTTTLRLLSTTLVPTAGSASIAGHDVVREASEARRNLGFLTGTTGIYERLTPREMVLYFGRLYGLDDATIARRIDELFELLDMHGFADTPNGRLSAGMKQKVSLARTIVHDPPVLIFDEPTTSLDVLVARTVTDFISERRALGRTIILSTHIMSEAEKLCDDLAILHHGRILTQGTLDEVLARSSSNSIEELFFSLIDACDAPSG